ncbi:unnamed protein product [Pylaiella littoralis]
MSNDIHTGDNHADDFDLFWGMGPTSENRRMHSSNVAEISTSSAPSNSGSTLSSTSSSLAGGGGLNTTTATLMGSLWSHGGAPHLEAYGHRHHAHASQGDGLQHVHSVGGSTPSPVRSRRPVWLPPPKQHHQHSSTSITSRGGGTGDSAKNHVGQHHHHPSSPVQAVAVDGGDGAAITPPPSSSSLFPANARLVDLKSSSSGGNIVSSSTSSDVACKLEELAAVITSSVLGKVDAGVREALSTSQQQHQQQQQQQSGGGVPFAAPRTAAALEDDQRRTGAAEAEAVAAAVAPLRSRLAALEEQMSQLMAAAALDRSGSSNNSSGGGGGSDTREGGRGSSGGVGGGVGFGRAGGGGSAAEVEPLLALNALAQRTGTLEGRHRQVQAKVALLDNYFGPKASDWAQTIKTFLLEREASGGAPRGAGNVAAVNSTAGGGGGKGGKKKLAVDAPVFSPRAARTGYGNGGAGGAPREGGAAAVPTGPPSVPLVDVGGTKHDKSAPEGNDDAVENTTTSATAASMVTAGVGRAGRVVDRCAACAETQERSSRLEKRVADSEETLALLQSKAPNTTSVATTAAVDAVKAWMATEISRRDAAAGKAVSPSGSLGRQQKALATSGGGGGGNWASKASLEKLAGELRQLSERMNDGDDAMAFVDHGLKGVRDEMLPLSVSVSALKRLVETQLREKELAAELLKGYVTTITREVATTTRHYINGLVSPAKLSTADSGGVAEQTAQPSVTSSAVAGAPAPLEVFHSAPPVVVVSVDDKDSTSVQNKGVDRS